MSKSALIRVVLCCQIVVATAVGASCSNEASEAASSDSVGTPVIFITDLKHPEGDPDDHIDTAILASLRSNVVAMVLESSHGIAPASQIAAIASTEWPTAVGSADGTDLILRTLASSPAPVSVVTVGSLKPLADAWRRDPELLREKVGTVAIFAGDATDLAEVEANVRVDPKGFLAIMGSGLPIRWIPCFDGGLWSAGTRSSFVQTEMVDLFPADLDPRLQKYFSYRLRESTADPLSWISEPVTSDDRVALETGLRNLWAAGLIPAAISGASVVFDGATVGGFEPVTVRFNANGQVDPEGSVIASVERWTVYSPSSWRLAMIALTVDALEQV